MCDGEDGWWVGRVFVHFIAFSFLTPNIILVLDNVDEVQSGSTLGCILESTESFLRALFAQLTASPASLTVLGTEFLCLRYWFP